MKRSRFITNITKKVLWKAIDGNSKVDYTRISDDSLDLMLMSQSKKSYLKEDNFSIMYVATHKSLWETVGIPYVIDKFVNDVPYVFAGDNLFKNKFLKILFDLTGVIKVTRGNIHHSEQLSKNIETLLSNGNDVLIFPEGSRSRNGLIQKFNTTSFQGAINASKKTQTYIIPINVDYSKILDFSDMTKSEKAYNFKLQHSFRWINSNIGKTYVSIGDPILVELGMDRKELAKISKEKTSNLVQILPINIYSKSIEDLNCVPGEGIKPDAIHENISKNIQLLKNHEDKFRGFNKHTSPQDIEQMCNEEYTLNRFFSETDLKKASIYSNYIKHYTK